MVNVAVYIDWQNAYQAARRAFSLSEFGLTTPPNEYGNFSPYQLAKILAAGNDRGEDGRLCRVEIHRGLPSSGRDRIGFAAVRRQAQAWIKEDPEVVIPRLRPLRYPDDPNEPPQEKGIDVNLAVGIVEQVLRQECDVGILFSHDTDLLPAIEAVARISSPYNIETAAWKSPVHHYRLRTKIDGVHHHDLVEDIFKRVETRVNYAASA